MHAHASELPTKRNVLTRIERLFDPLQFLSCAPFTIRAKIRLTIQKIWTAGVEWDEQLPENRRVEWNDWINDLNDLSNFEIPRTLRLPKPTKSWLHTIFRRPQRCECCRVLSVSCL